MAIVLLFFQFSILTVLIQLLCSAILPVDFIALGSLLPFFSFNSGFVVFIAALFIFVFVKSEYALKTMFLYFPLIALLLFSFGGIFWGSLGLWFWGVLFFVSYAVWYLQCLLCSYKPGLIYLLVPVNFLAGLFIYVDYVHYLLTREHFKTYYFRILELFDGGMVKNLGNLGITPSLFLYLALLILFLGLVSLLIAKFSKRFTMNSFCKRSGFAFSFAFLLIFGQFYFFSAGIFIEDYFDFRIRNFWFPIPDHPSLKSKNLDSLQNQLLQAKLSNEMFNRQPEFKWKENSKQMNIVFLLIESLRADVLESLMPRTAKLAKEGIWCKNHLSNANETEGALIALYYNSLPLVSERSYCDNNAANWIEFMQARDYEFLRLTHSAGNLHYPEYQYTLVKDYFNEKHRVEFDESPAVKDSMLICDAILERLKNDEKVHLIEGLLHHTHYKYWYPKKFERFKPVLEDNREIIELDFAEVALRFRNRYKNSILFTDWLIADFVGKMKKAGLFENTILVIMGDHGQNLGENGAMFHGTSPDILQNKTTCIILGGNVEPTEISSMTSHFDIVPTLGTLVGFETLNSAGQDMLQHKNEGTVTFDISGSNRMIYRDSDGLSSLFSFTAGSQLKWGVTCNHGFVFDERFQNRYNSENLELTLSKAKEHSRNLIEIIRRGKKSLNN